MLIINDIQPSKSETAVALGCFDGVHLGHLSVISAMVKAATDNLTPTVFTFADLPISKRVNPESKNIITRQSKRELLYKIGVRQLYEVPFFSVMSMEANEFVKSVLVNTLQAKKVFCGFNYHFGRGGFHNAKDLKTLCEAHDIKVKIMPAVFYNGEIISSTKIKSLIIQGDMSSVKQMLGRYFFLESRVIHGQKIGRTLGTPTMNQKLPDSLVTPRFGVYASVVTVNEVEFLGLTNIGVKPTVGSKYPVVETWMPNYKGEELYGKIAKVELLEFIRPERKFDTLEQLKQAILSDAKKAENIYIQRKIRTD